MRTLKLTLAYDGTNYVGWQRQANGAVGSAGGRGRVRAADASRARAPTVAGAGRTDAGVHALGQVASVDARDRSTPPSAVQRALNVRLPADIRVVGVVDAPPGFHAQFHADGQDVSLPHRRRRRCCRRSIGGSCGTRRRRERRTAMRRGRRGARRPPRLRVVPGARRVRARTRCGRSLASTSARPPARSSIEIDGDGFLRHMVRTIVGTLAEIGAGPRPPWTSMRGDARGARSRARPGRPRRRSGLTLVSVRY